MGERAGGDATAVGKVEDVHLGRLQMVGPGYTLLFGRPEQRAFTHRAQSLHHYEAAPTHPPPTPQGKRGPGLGSTPPIRSSSSMVLGDKWVVWGGLESLEGQHL